MVEKHVLLDLMFEPHMKRFFINNKSFPYSAGEYLESHVDLSKLFIAWNHYYDVYSKSKQKFIKFYNFLVRKTNLSKFAKFLGVKFLILGVAGRSLDLDKAFDKNS